MNDTMPSHPATAAAAAAQTQSGVVVPLPNRRPRVREVSSRFMSSLSTTPGGGGGGGGDEGGGGGGDLPILQPVKSPKHVGGCTSTLSPAQYQAKLMLQRSKTDHYHSHHHHHHHDTVVRRSYSDSPLGLHNYNKVLPTAHSSSKQRGASVKLLFKENNDGRKGEHQEQQQRQHLSSSDDDSEDVVLQYKKNKSSSSRPDTPIASSATAADRIVPSRFRQKIYRSQTNNLTPASAAAKLLQSSGLSISANSVGQEDPCIASFAKFPLTGGSSSSTVHEEDEEKCNKTFHNSPLSIQKNLLRTWTINTDMRSSMPDNRLLHPERSCTTTNNVGDSNLNLKLSSASPCSRSLNLPLINSTVKMMRENLCLPPPHPPLSKPATGDAARKGKKIFTHQEQAHFLKLLHNQYLQWSFANAKSQASLRAQARDTEVCICIKL